jgi:hypothetical protein
MNLLDTLLQSAGGGALQRVGQQLGINDSQTKDVLGKLMPALTGAIKRNTTGADGVRSLQKALTRGNHSRYLDDPNALADQTTVDDGNSILGHLLGSKEASRDVASNVATETGIDASIIKKLLPLAAAATMGAVSKGTGGGKELAGGGALGILGGLLDSVGDGKILGNILSLGKKMF